MISIGAVYHGPELKGSEINLALMRVSKALNEFRGPLILGKAPWLNAVFVVSGSLRKADFEYLEYGKYSLQDKGIVVQIPVSEMTIGKSNLTSFLVDSLHGANAMAFDYFRQRGESFSLLEAEKLVDQVAECLKGDLN